MPEEVQIILDADGAFSHYRDVVERGDLEAITTLEAGTAEGRPSVGFIIKTQDGRVIFTDTTMHIFLAAADMMRARYLPQEGRF